MSSSRTANRPERFTLRAVLRLLFLVPLGYILAIVAAAMVITAAAARSYDTDAPTLFVQYFVTLPLIGSVAFGPAAAVVAAAEIFRLRSVFYFVLAGGILGLLLNQWTGSDLTAVAFDRQDLVFPAAGFAGGFVYWLIVGRLSGRFNLAAANLPPVREDKPDANGATPGSENPVDRPQDDGRSS